MQSYQKSVRRRAGVALIVSMIFVVIFSALGVCIATMSGTNVQIASNQQDLNAALAAAQSGQEVVRYWISQVLISSSTPQDQYLSEIITALQTELTKNGITNVTLANDGSITAVTLDSGTGRNFDGRLSIDPNQPKILQVRITGYNDPACRTIITSYSIEPYEFPIFNYGLATKGPLDFPNNPTVTAVNEAWEADMFVESSSSSVAVHVGGNTNFDGDITIGNPSANVDFVGDVNIAGDVGQTAIDKHVTFGADSPEFPAPDTDRFLQYTTGQTVDSSTDLSSGITLTNATIAAGTDPVFKGNATIEGVLYIESPNVVTFEKNVELYGLIVGDGDLNNVDTTANQIDIMGNFSSQVYPSGLEFDAIRQEKGTSIVAPGFGTTFGGNFSAIEGVVAVSGAQFTGNMSATIKGTIINYGDAATFIDGNATMDFDRASSVKIPAGFDLYRELEYEPSLYCEVAGM